MNLENQKCQDPLFTDNIQDAVATERERRGGDRLHGCVRSSWESGHFQIRLWKRYSCLRQWETDNVQAMGKYLSRRAGVRKKSDRFESWMDVNAPEKKHAPDQQYANET